MGEWQTLKVATGALRSASRLEFPATFGRRTSAVRALLKWIFGRMRVEGLEVNAMCFLIEEETESLPLAAFKQDMQRHVGFAEIGDLCQARLGLPVNPRCIGTRCTILYLKVCGETSLLFRKCSEAR